MCNYYINKKCALFKYKVICTNNGLWTPKGYIRGVRADLSILDDYNFISKETIEEVLKSYEDSN